MAITTASSVPVSNGDRTSISIRTGMAVVWAISIAKLIFHIYFNKGYGYFGDEFDYMSCGSHGNV